MFWFSIMAVGLIASALLHYLFRNTYTKYEVVKGVKVWQDKTTLRRKDFILCYGINVLPPLNIVVLAFLYFCYFTELNNYDFHLEINNKFTRWLNEEV